uniref:hypothetical protein n=1 Tax=Treponema sp. TaxID=166 RepID=UPI00298E3446
GSVIDIRLRFNKPLKFAGEGKPKIKLNNGAVVEMDTDTSAEKFPNLYTEGEREYSFKYTVENNVAREADKLTVAVDGFNLNGCTIADGKITQGMVNELTKTGSGANLGDRKTISISISNPKVEGIAFEESTGVLSITYSKKVKKNRGSITITQKDVTNVPPVLSESEYRLLVAKAPGLKAFYESGTNGATGDAGSYVADTTPKYILKYDKEITDPVVLGLYKETKNHILSAEIGSNRVEFTVDGEGKKSIVKVNFGANPLPCKGAEYEIEVPEGIVIEDVKIGTGLKSESKSTTITASGIETPVIRIKKTNATITNYVSSQPLTTEFKVDCATPGSSVTYSVQRYERESYEITGETTPASAPGVSKSSQGTDSMSLGDDTISGMEYEITATATKNGNAAIGKEIAFRTIVRINGIKDKLSEVKMGNTYSGRWVPADCPGGIGLFIRGGNNISGPNSIEGYPTSWDSTDCTQPTGAKTILMTNINGTKDYYMATWAITGDYYFRFLAGLMDNDTNTNSDGIGKGPKYGIYSQNAWVPGTNSHPVHAGGMVTVRNDSSGCDFDIEATGGIKAQKYRD